MSQAETGRDSAARPIFQPSPGTIFLQHPLWPPRLFARLMAHCSLTTLGVHDKLLL
jgi:hypothetical protein